MELRPSDLPPAEPRDTSHQWVYERKVCDQCKRRRQCLMCVCCDENVCRECLWKTEPAHSRAVPACLLCVEESRQSYNYRYY